MVAMKGLLFALVASGVNAHMSLINPIPFVAPLFPRPLRVNLALSQSSFSVSLSLSPRHCVCVLPRPRRRNAIDRQLPGWSGGKWFPFRAECKV